MVVQLAVCVLVQKSKPTSSIGLEFVIRDVAIPVGIGLGKPDGHGIGLAGFCTEDLAKRADKDSAGHTASHWRRRRRHLGLLRLGLLGKAKAGDG